MRYFLHADSSNGANKDGAYTESRHKFKFHAVRDKGWDYRPNTLEDEPRPRPPGNHGIVHLVLDISRKQLRYSLNEGWESWPDYGIIGMNVHLGNEQCRLAVAMERGEIELVAFSITHK